MELIRIGGKINEMGKDRIGETIRFWTMSVAEYLDEYFETDVIKTAKSASGIIGTALGIHSPGTAYVLLHHYMGDVDGNVGSWGFARGGTGAVANAIAAGSQVSNCGDVAASARQERNRDRRILQTHFACDIRKLIPNTAFHR